MVRGVVACLVAGLAVGTLSGCGAARVDIRAPAALSADDEAACEQLVQSLPNTVSGQVRRSVNPDDALGAAWGDTPIVLTCGVGPPAGFDDFSLCQVGNGVGWFVPDQVLDDQSAEVVMTTVEYAPAVEVRIPPSYRPEGPAAVMAELAPVIKSSLTRVDRCV